MKLRLPRLPSKKAAGFVAAALVLPLSAAGFVSRSAWSATQTYQQHIAAYTASIRQSYTHAAQSLATDKNPERAVAILSGLQTELKTPILPPEPTVLSVTTLGDTRKQARQTVDEQMADLSQTLETMKAIIKYQSDVARIVVRLHSQKTENLEQLKNLYAAWAIAASDLKSLNPPEQSKDLHRSMIEPTDAVAADLDALTQLFEKQDTAGFSFKKQEFAGHLAALQHTGRQFTALAVALDSQFTQRLHSLASALESL